MTPHDQVREESSGASPKRVEQLLLDDGYEHMRSQHYEQAVDIFNRMLKRFDSAIDDTQKSLLHGELATLYLWLADYHSAQYHAERAVSFGNKNDYAYSVLGKCAVAQFDFPRARRYFSAITEGNPLKPLGLTLVSIKLRETSKARTFLHEACAQLPSSDLEARIYDAYIRLLEGDTKGALASIHSIDATREPFLHAIVGEIYMTGSSFGEAAAVGKKILKHCPSQDAAYALLANASYAAQEFVSAKNYASEAVRLNPRNAYAKTVFMKLYTRDGNYRSAENLGREVLHECPEYSLVHANLGDVYFIQGLYELAAVEYGETEQLMDSQTKGARLRQARIKFINEDYKGAANMLDDLVEDSHTYYDDAMCDLALCYDALDDKKKKEDIIDKMEMRRSFYYRTEKLLEQFNED